MPPPSLGTIGGKAPGWWIGFDVCDYYGSGINICHPCNSPFPKPAECDPPWIQDGDPSGPECYSDHSSVAAYQIPATKGTGYLVDGTTLAPPINRFPYIPGTLLSWCPNNCRPPKGSGKVYGLCFTDTSIFGCDVIGKESGSIVRPTPWKEPKLTQKLISSTVPNNEVNNVNTRTSKLITTNPIRTLSVNPYGQLYIQNYARFTQGGITEEFKKHGIHSTTHDNIDIKIIKVNGDEPKYPDFTQISHGQTYACGIYTNGCILYDSLFTTPNQGCTLLTDNYLVHNRNPWPSDLVFWNKTNRVVDGGNGWNLIDFEQNEATFGGVNDALHPLTLDWANTPFFISGNKSATGEGDVFATIWTNTSNPYRSFGMNYFRVYEGFGDGGSEGISWQANYSDIPDGVFGVRPDLLIWRAANQLYNQYITKGFTGCSGWGGTGICSNLEWDGWSGWTAPMCNKDRAYPSTVYYKQISLGNQHGLVSLGYYTPNVGITADNIQGLDVAGDQLHSNRREKIEWLFQFSGSTAANITTSSDWSTENLVITVDAYALNPANPGSAPNSAITKLTYTRKDFTYEVGITAPPSAPGGPDQEIRIPDTYNNFCRWSSFGAGIDDEEDPSAPLIGNPYICNPSLSIGFTCCFRSAITFGHSTHPIWTDSSKIPNIFLLSAAVVSTRINGGQLTSNASWEWISAGSSGNSCAILSYNDSDKTNISDTIRKCICWGPRYNKSDIEIKHWPDVNIQEHYTMEQGCSGYAMGITWHPCQVDCSLESPIFYHKSWPYSSYHIDGPASYLYTPGLGIFDPNAGRVTYNTLAKVTVWDGISWSHQSNATIDDPIATHYKYTGKWPPNTPAEYSNTENIKINKILNFPNGLNNFHNYTWNAGTSNDYQWWGWYKAYPNWGTYPITFLPRDISFNSSRLHHFGYPQDTPVQWMNQLNFPSWTPIYPVVSGNSWLMNLFDNAATQPNVCCLFDGVTGCCETDQKCYPGIEQYDCDFLGGTWTQGECDQSYCDNKCYGINTNQVQLNVNYSQQIKTVNLSSDIPVCIWTAKTNNTWLTINTKPSTQNDIVINISENTSTQNRLGTVTVTETNTPQNIKTIQINQLADNGGGGGGGGDGGVNCCDYFTGPCCTNTQCEENKTPQECHNSKGIFLGFNKTCDDCPT